MTEIILNNSIDLLAAYIKIFKSSFKENGMAFFEENGNNFYDAFKKMSNWKYRVISAEELIKLRMDERVDKNPLNIKTEHNYLLLIEWRRSSPWEGKLDQPVIGHLGSTSNTIVDNNFEENLNSKYNNIADYSYQIFNQSLIQEGIIYVPHEQNKLVKVSPLIKSPLSAFESQKEKEEFYLTDKELEEYQKGSITISPSSLTSLKVPVKHLSEEEIFNFILGERNSKDYGEFLNEIGIKFLNMEFLPREYVNSQGRPFSRPIVFGELVPYEANSIYCYRPLFGEKGNVRTNQITIPNDLITRWPDALCIPISLDLNSKKDVKKRIEEYLLRQISTEMTDRLNFIGLTEIANGLEEKLRDDPK